MTEEAREYLVTQYRNLRQSDATGIARASYRITVRQLESMIRLSEALAKLHGSEEIVLRHVSDAAYLLKTSIVQVEQENVDVEEFDEVMRASEAMDMQVDQEETLQEV
jgi:DNA replication licensing factor MCM6